MPREFFLILCLRVCAIGRMQLGVCNTPLQIAELDEEEADGYPALSGRQGLVNDFGIQAEPNVALIIYIIALCQRGNTLTIY